MAEVKKVSIQDVKQQKADKSKDNKAAGGSNVIVSITDTVKVKFTKDFGFMKKGHIQDVSVLAYEMYDQNKCVEKVN